MAIDFPTIRDRLDDAAKSSDPDAAMREYITDYLLRTKNSTLMEAWKEGRIMSIERNIRMYYPKYLEMLGKLLILL